jgi:hypothetical protein
MLSRALLLLTALLLPAVASGQAPVASAQRPIAAAPTIHRCEAPHGRITYSDTDCPAGSRAVKALAPARQPDAAAQKEARERAQRYHDLATDLAAQRQQSRQSVRPAAYVPAEQARRASDCAYLRAELDASRRLRSVLTTRPYYSYDDVEQADARTSQLAADYRRFCSR